jgi:S-adenosylmethionine decarboxylase
LKTLGRHLIGEYYSCSPVLLNDTDGIRRHMLAAAECIGATVMGEMFRRFEPQGVSGTVIIAESHLSIHTWPESNYVAVDIFTCGGLDPRPGFEMLGKVLDCECMRLQEILRGVPEDLLGARELLPEDVTIISETAPLIHLRAPKVVS